MPSTFNHKKSGHTFKITVSSTKEGMWTRFRAISLCPICKEELQFGFSGRIQKETEVKSSAKAGSNLHLKRNHRIS
jgi:hypothetical protein